MKKTQELRIYNHGGRWYDVQASAFSICLSAVRVLWAFALQYMKSMQCHPSYHVKCAAWLRFWLWKSIVQMEIPSPGKHPIYKGIENENYKINYGRYSLVTSSYTYSSIHNLLDTEIDLDKHKSPISKIHIYILYSLTQYKRTHWRTQSGLTEHALFGFRLYIYYCRI